MGLNDVSSATVVSGQRCEAKVLGGFPRRLLRRYGRCALRCGETGLRWVTRLQGEYDVRGEVVMKTGL